MSMPGSDRGAALVEAALVIPLVILIVLGVTDVSRAFFVKAAVQESAQEGAIYAALNPGDPAGAITRAEEAVDRPNLAGSITVTCPAPFQVTVTVDHQFDLITPFMSSFFGGPIDLTHSETSRVLSSTVCAPSP